MRFTTNVGSADRILRVVVGVILIGLAISGVFNPWGLAGFVLIATAFMKFCPAYAILGLKSLPEAKT